MTATTTTTAIVIIIIAIAYLERVAGVYMCLHVFTVTRRWQHLASAEGCIHRVGR